MECKHATPLINYNIISNGSRTEWSPIRSVIIRVINKIGRPRSGSPICLITSMIADQIGRPGGGGTPIRDLYGYVPPNGVVILKLLI